jgi:hypothetical protein
LQNAAQQHVIADMMSSSVAAKSAMQRPSSSLSLPATQRVSAAVVAPVANEPNQSPSTVFKQEEHVKQHGHQLSNQHDQQQKRSASASRHSSCVRILRALAAVDRVAQLLVRCLEIDYPAAVSAEVEASVLASPLLLVHDARVGGPSCFNLLFTRLKAVKCGTPINRSNETLNPSLLQILQKHAQLCQFAEIILIFGILLTALFLLQL